MDIRKYFSPQGTTKGTSKLTEKLSNIKSKKVATVTYSDEDVVPNTPVLESKKQSSKTKKKRKVTELDSDSDESLNNKHETPKKAKTMDKKPKKIVLSSSESETDISKKSDVKTKSNGIPKKTKSDLKPISILDAFGSAPIVQTKVEKPRKAFTENASNAVEFQSDEEFEKTLELIDEEELLENAISTPAPANNAKTVSSSSSEKKTPKKRKLTENKVDIALQAQEKHEKRQYSALLYQKYLNRSGPAHHGSKEIPRGKPDCLKNLCFLITGVLDSLERHEVEELIKDHGGRTVNSVSKKVNYVVKGHEAGPSKLAKAESYQIPVIEEDDLLNMIRKKSEITEKKEMKIIVGTGSDVTKENASNKAVQEKPVVKKGDPSPKKTTVKSKFPAEKKTTTMIIDLETLKARSNKNNTDSRQTPEVAIKKEKNASEYSLKIETKKVPLVKKEVEQELAVANKTSVPNLSWVDKYKPTDINRIIGQQGDSSCVKKLQNWLKNWYTIQNGKTKLVRPSPWAKNDNGAFFKAALLSGPPGIGKTTSANLVSKQLGYDIVEFNASDTRNKKLIHDDIGQILNTTSISGYFKEAGATSKKHVLIMDEVDGMSGNEDRGGMQELIGLIKTTNVPIICICNDRNHQKVRSLANHCFDLRFNKPKMEQIRGYLMTICFQEGIDMKPNILGEIINGTGQDIRQSINNLYMWSTKDKTLSMEDAKKGSQNSQRDAMMTQWDVVKKVFTIEDQQNVDVAGRARLFFNDYSMGPLFVYENYLHVQPDGCRGEDLNKLLKAANAAESLSRGDLIESSIRRLNNWSLLEAQAMFSSVLPGYYMRGHFNKQINFPNWLGKNSRKNKFVRLYSELRCHMSTCISGSKQALHMDYAKYIRDGVVKPLIKKGSDGLEDSINFMQSYNLLREDLDSLCEITQWLGQNPFSSVDSKVKTAFTRTYNKKIVVPYAITSGVVKKKSAVNDTDNYEMEDAEFDEEADLDDDTVENDAMIMAKKTNKPSKSTTSKAESKTKKAANGLAKGKRAHKK